MSISRQTSLLVLGLSTLLLAGTSWKAFQTVAELRSARLAVTSSQIELDQLQAQMPAVEQHEQFARSAQAFQAAVTSSNLDPANWVDRRISRTTTAMTRQEAEAFLRQQVGGGAGQWFAADRFDVGVITPSAGLFTPAQADDRGFSVEMSGTVFFPLNTP